jgi:hypothetical protein
MQPNDLQGFMMQVRSDRLRGAERTQGPAEATEHPPKPCKSLLSKELFA